MTFFSNLSSLFGPAGQPAKTAKSTDRLKQALQKVTKQPATAGSPVNVPPATNNPPAKSAVKETKAKPTKQDQQEAQAIVREAKAQAREIIVEAKDNALEIKSQAERTARHQEEELNQRERLLDKKIDKLDYRLEEINQKEQHLEQTKQKIKETQEEIALSKAKLLKRLEEISGLTEQEAKQVLFDGLEKKMTQEMAKVVRQKEEEAQQEAHDKARDILVDVMRLGATDYVAEYTVSVVQLASADIKGKIIGKSGRNIHSFERKTGVDLDLDFSETEIRLSSFDPVRREIAKISLERLIKDGRIQPERIEKTIDKVKTEIDQIIFEAGKDLCQKVGVYNLPVGLIKTLGRFKYRFSYGQNMIKHTLEETKIGIKLAHELDLDVNTVKVGCLLHDIGKVADTAEGSHVELGVKIAKNFGMPQGVIDCIAQHHEDEPFSGPEQMVVYIADAISGARPGARYENLEEYVERLENLEQIATSYSEVAEAYAVKAGREIRVLLNPEKSKDDDVTILATKIKDKIQGELTFPGTVTVNVIRELRAQATAK